MKKWQTFSKNKQKLIKSTLVLGMAVFLYSMFLVAERTNASSKNEVVAIQTPTILVPGTNATNNRFNGFINKLSSLGVDTVDVLKVYVQKNGAITFSGDLSAKSAHPLIVVGFEDNSEDAVDIEAKWLKQAIQKVQETYKFEAYNYIGHSNGGLVLTSFLENYNDDTLPTLLKAATIATPYNDVSFSDNDKTTEFTEVKNETNLLKNSISKQSAIPSSISFLNIAGVTSDTSYTDSVVPVQSVLSGRLVYENQVANYEEYLVTGEETTHSELVENKKVLLKIKSFLYNE